MWDVWVSRPSWRVSTCFISYLLHLRNNLDPKEKRREQSDILMIVMMMKSLMPLWLWPSRMFVAIRDYSDYNHSFGIVNLIDADPERVPQEAFYCEDPDDNTLSFVPRDFNVVGYWCAWVSVSKKGYQVIDHFSNNYPQTKQWAGYPYLDKYLYFPNSYILHSGFHMTPYCDQVISNQESYVQLKMKMAIFLVLST